jgi:hypothetical protein
MEKYLRMNPNEMESVIAKNYFRNVQLIDLNYIPDQIKEKVMDSYNLQANKDRSKLMNYFVANKLRNLTEHIGEF